MPTPVDNYRVEIWSADEGERVEVLAQSSDNFLSQAAWNEACERFPGVLLVHYNNRFVMQRRRAGELNPSKSSQQ